MMLRLTCHISPFIQLADRSFGRRVGGRGWWSVTLGGVLREREFGACCCVARSLDGVSLFSPFFNWSITPSDYRNFLFLYYDAIVVHVCQLCYEDDNKINFTCAKLSTPKTNMDDIGFRWEHSKNRGKKLSFPHFALALWLMMPMMLSCSECRLPANINLESALFNRAVFVSWFYSTNDLAMKKEREGEYHLWNRCHAVAKAVFLIDLALAAVGKGSYEG